MKFLLMRYYPAENILGASVRRLQEEVGVLPPLGLAHIAAVLEAEGYTVEVLDCFGLGLSEEESRARIRSAQADVIGITTMTYTLHSEMVGARLAYEESPKSLIMVGGPNMDLYPRETLQRYGFVDFGVCGEGEQTVLELADRLYRGVSCEGMPGLVYRARRNGELVQTPPRSLIENLDTLPFPSLRQLPLDRYHSVMTQARPNIYLYTTRGCPFYCRYCVKPQWGRHIRSFTASYVVDQIQHYVSAFGIKEFHMYDDTFTVNRRRVLEICHLLKRRGLDVPWSIRTRVDLVDEELLESMRSAGCYRIYYGVESGDEAILERMGRGTTIEQIRRAFRISKELKFETFAYYMIGYPGESRATYRKTLRLAKELDSDYAYFSITTALPGTEIYEEAIKEGLARGDEWRAYVLGKERAEGLGNVRFRGLDYSVEELDRMAARAYWSFYFRPKVIWRTLRRVASFEQFFRYARHALAMVRSLLGPS